MDRGSQPKLFTRSYLVAFNISILVWCASSVLTAAVPLFLVRKFSASPGEIGLIVGLSATSTIVARPFMGYALDLFGRKRILLLSLLICGLINFAYLFANSPLAVFGVRFIQGIPFAAATTALVTVASDMIPDKRRGEGLSYFTSASTLALALGPGIGIALFNRYTSLPFVVAGLIGVVCFGATSLVVIPKFKGTVSTFSIGSVFDKRVAFMAMIAAICCLGIPGLLSFGSLYAKEISIPLEQFSYAYTFYAFGLLVTRMVVAKTMDRQTPQVAGAVSISMFFIGMLMMGLWQTLPGIFVASFFLGGGMGIILPTLLIMAMELAPDKKGVCNALVFGGLDVAFSLGAFLFGLTAGGLRNYGNTYTVFSIFDVVALGIFLLFTMPFFEKERKKLGILA